MERKAFDFDTRENRLSETVSDVFSSVADLFRRFKNRMTQLGIDDIVALYEDRIIAHILKKEQSDDLFYAGGEMSIVYASSKTMALKLTLYFKDAKNQWVKTSASTACDIRCLLPEALQELSKKKNITFDIELPEGSGRSATELPSDDLQ